LYNSQSTPIPVLRVEVWRSAMSILDEMLAQAEISMVPLLLRPGAWAERWHLLHRPGFAAKAGGGVVLSGGGSAAGAGSQHCGMVLLSLRFQPARHAGRPGMRSGAFTSQVVLSPGQVPVSPSPRVPTFGWHAAVDGGGSTPGGNRRDATAAVMRLPDAGCPSGRLQSPLGVEGGGGGFSRKGRTCSAASAALGAAPGDSGLGVVRSSCLAGDKLTLASFNERTAQQPPPSPARPDSTHHGGFSAVAPAAPVPAAEAAHLFRLNTYRSPQWCAVCGGMLLGLFGQGFQCEVCGLDVHKGCQVKANFTMGCRPDAGGSGDGGDHRALAASDPAVDGAVPMVSGKPSPSLELSGGGGGGLGDMAGSRGNAGGGGLAWGVGLLQLRLESAHRCSSRCHDGFHEPGGGGAGERDHYCRVRFRNRSPPQSRRTQTVFQTSNPRFDTTWVLVAPAYDAVVSLELVDASNDRLVGVMETSVFALVQRDHDARAVGLPKPSEAVHDHALSFDPSGTAPDFGGGGDDSGGGGSSGGAAVTGLLRLQMAFVEDTDGLFRGPWPRRVPPRAPDDLSVDALRRYMERSQAILGWVAALSVAYRRVMAWEDPTLTSLLLLGFVYVTALADAEYVLAVPPGCLLAYMTITWARRRDGRFVRDRIVQKAADGSGDGSGAAAVHQPLAQLRVAVVRGRGLVSSDLGLQGNAFVRVSLSPDPDVSMADGLGSNSGSGLGGGSGVVGGSDDRAGDEPEADSDGGVAEALIGETPPHEVSADPDWSRGGAGGVGRARGDALGIYGRGDALLQNMTEIWPRSNASSGGSSAGDAGGDGSGDGEDLAFVYPVLQPVRKASGRKGSAGAAAEVALLPWESSRAFVRFAIFFANPFQSLMDSFQGDVIVPVAALVDGAVWDGSAGPTASSAPPGASGSAFAATAKGAQREVAGWFRVSQPDAGGGLLRDGDADEGGGGKRSGVSRWGSTGTTKARRTLSLITADGSSGGASPGDSGEKAVFLRLQLVLPDPSKPATADDVDASAAVRTMLYGARASHAREGHTGSHTAAAAASIGTPPQRGGAKASTALTTAVSAAKPGAGGSRSDDAAAAAAAAAAQAVAATAASSGGGGVSTGGGGGGTMSTLLNLRSTVRDYQGTLGSVLDAIEAGKNLFNWTHPPKTALAFGAIFTVWVLLLVVPGRYVVLVVGLYEFLAKFIPFSKAPPGQPPSALSIKLTNLLHSVPTDEDLRLCYRREALAHARGAEARARLREQRAKLSALGISCQWDGVVRARQRAGEAWAAKYLVVQVRR
ncbi:unnamed protein product, partial [Phaeothamnion confervicola]